MAKVVEVVENAEQGWLDRTSSEDMMKLASLCILCFLAILVLSIAIKGGTEIMARAFDGLLLALTGTLGITGTNKYFQKQADKGTPLIGRRKVVTSEVTESPIHAAIPPAAN